MRNVQSVIMQHLIRVTCLHAHLKAVHDRIKDNKCSQRDYASSSSSAMTRHIKKVHDKIKDYKCVLCEYAGSSKTLLTKHVKIIHQKIKNFHKCPHCDSVLSDKSK
jgi:hypothetical protein